MNKLSVRQSLWMLPFFLLISFNIWSYQTHQDQAYDRAVEIAVHKLPSKGILKQGPDGYVYLKVPEKVVYKLFPYVKEPGFTLPSHIKRHTKVGAHLSVFYKKEAARIGPIQELGQTYSFEPKRIRHVRAGAKEYIILEVYSPQLEQLRRHYGLAPKLMNHEFHITLAEKRLK